MTYEYDITLSFAGEDRKFVDRVAELLKENKVKVFYDKFEEADLWGKDLGIHFDTVYRKSAKYCIPFISKYYKEKIWTNFEVKNIICRAIEQNEEYILPVRFDDTEIDGIRPTIGFIDVRDKEPEYLVNLILEKLGSDKKIPIAQQFQEKRKDILTTTIFETFLQSSFGIQPNGPIISVTITNKLKGDYRYFYEPTFRVQNKNKKEIGFRLINVLNEYKFPLKIEHGEEIEIKYELSRSQLDLWEKFKKESEFYSICSTTVGEKFESNLNKVSSIIDTLKSL